MKRTREREHPLSCETGIEDAFNALADGAERAGRDPLKVAETLLLLALTRLCVLREIDNPGQDMDGPNGEAVLGTADPQLH
jgi:hypothetical protein